MEPDGDFFQDTDYLPFTSAFAKPATFTSRNSCFRSFLQALPAAVPFCMYAAIKKQTIWSAFYKTGNIHFSKVLFSFIPAGSACRCPVLYVCRNKKADHLVCFLQNRQRPAFPGGRPPSIISAKELNCCVRDGNRCTLPAIVTGFFP